MGLVSVLSLPLQDASERASAQEEIRRVCE